MSRRRRSQTFEPISELFGDVVRDRPPLLYGPGGEDAELSGPGPVAIPARPQIAEARAAAHATVARASKDAQPEHLDDRGLLSAVVVLHAAIAVLSLGLGAAWLKTEQRRLIWSHTRLKGEPLEYLGSGGELLAGALVGLAATAGALGAATLAAALVGPALTEGQAAPATMVGAAALLLPLLPLASFRSRRHALSRTRWRGVRFGMDGSGFGMIGLWIVWMPAVVASAGLLWPFWRWARERRMSRTMRWGDLSFGFTGAGWRLLPHWLPLWALLAAGAGLAAMPEARAAVGLDGWPQPEPAFGVPALAAGLGAALAVWLLWCNYRAAEIRAFWEARRLAGVEVRCTLSLWALADAHLEVVRRLFWPGLLVGFLMAAVAAIPHYASMGGEMEAPAAPGLEEAVSAGRASALGLMALVVDVFLAAVLAIWLRMAVHAQTLHQRICDSLRFVGAHELEPSRPGARAVPEAAGRGGS